MNAWENRCPHRGVRLSIGTNLGHALKCRYHGWTYESGSARCIAIPCHPRLTPAAAIRVRAYPCMERRGHVWVRLAEEDDGDGGIEAGASGTSGGNGEDGRNEAGGANGAGRTGEPGGARRAGAGTPNGASDANRESEVDGAGKAGEPDGAGRAGVASAPDGVNDAGASPVGAADHTEPEPTLRSVHVDAPAATVAAAFAHYEDAAAGPVQVEADAADPWTVHVLGGRDGDLRFMLQPLSERATVIHGVLAARTPRLVSASTSAAVSASAPASAPRHPLSSTFAKAPASADVPASASAPAGADVPADTGDRLAVLRRHNAALGAVRDAAERQVPP